MKTETVINLEAAQTVMRDHFVGWQCRLRQFSVREESGRPSSGMQPDIALPDGIGFEAVKLLIVRGDPTIFNQEFRHMIRRTSDPKQRYDSALKYLSSNYYQHPEEFSDRPTALFASGSRAGAAMLDAGHVTMLFAEKKQSYKIPAEVRRLTEPDHAWQATYWHNHLFNARLPAEIDVLQFVPDWVHATAEPPVY